MIVRRRWDRCICHRGRDVERFVAEHVGDERRQLLLIAGAGFDPRSTVVAELLSAAARGRVRALFIREERPRPSLELVKRADQNLHQLIELVADHTLKSVRIFAADGAVIGGREAIRAIGELDLSPFTDIVVDLSALSKGVVFPIVRRLLDLHGSQFPSLNLHLMVTDEPTTDDALVASASDTVSAIHGFRGGLGLDATQHTAKLWFPQLIRGRRAVLERIYAVVRPHDVCPILPFPAWDPRLGDDLIEHYLPEFEGIWNVDTRDIVYADEKNPLDLYRTLLRIDAARKRVFAEVGGSLTVLSPIGSKVLSIGALMAAIEHDFPVVYCEAIEYVPDLGKLDRGRSDHGEVVHIWLCGEAYSCLA